MSKGGGDQVTTQEPNSIVSPYLNDLYTRSKRESLNSPEFYPGETYVGGLPQEEAAFQQQFDYMNNAFGTGGMFENMTDAAGRLASGNTNAGTLSQGTGQQFLQNLDQFNQPTNLIGDWQSGYTPQQTQLGFQQPGFGAPQLDPNQFTPGVSQTVTQDPNAAIGQMLSGQGDYSQLGDLTKAVADPMINMLQEDIMPSIVSQAVGTNNQTSLAKDINRIVPRVMENISNQSTQLGFQEMQRAKDAQNQGAGLATQAGLTQGGQGLQAYGLGLQGAGTQAGLESNTDQFLSSLGLSAAGQQAGLDQNYQQMMSSLGLSNAGLGLQSDIAQQGANDAYRQDILGLGGLSSGLSGQMSDDMYRGAGLIPGAIQTGLMPSQTSGAYADYQRGLAEAALGDDMARYNYGQNIDKDMLSWYAQQLNGTAGIGGTTTTPYQSGGMGGALGGAATGAGLASSLALSNPWTAALAGIGGLAGSK